MEIETFWPDNQALLLGIATLIYGVLLLMNPMFGLASDVLAGVSEGAGRRICILCGIVLSAFGITMCMFAGPRHRFLLYMGGIMLWRVGESLIDVTTEAILPDLVPVRQFGFASAIRSVSFTCGGLIGFILLYCMADVHYTWYYYAYLGAMFVMAVPPLCLLVKDSPAPQSTWRTGTTFTENISNAYIVPMNFSSGFPEVSFAIFTISVGISPMFFLMPFIRDLVGVHNQVELLKDFACGSILFFLAAVGGSIIDVQWGGRTGPSQRGEFLVQATDNQRRLQRQRALEWEDENKHRLDVLVYLSGIFAVLVLLLAFVHYLPTIRFRLALLYPIVLGLGITFGLGYSRFQDATWRMLPSRCDMANAMGFNVMARSLGLVIGTLLSGCLLQLFRLHSMGSIGPANATITATPELTISQQVYGVAGYDWMCLGSLCFIAYGGFITWRIKRSFETAQTARPAG
jgi:hypothetical protein